MLENMMFEKAVTKMSLLEEHENFKNHQIHFKMIGLVERNDETKTDTYHYAPFGKIILDTNEKLSEGEYQPQFAQISLKGMFIANNPKIKYLLKDKNEVDKMLRDVQDSMKYKDK